MPLFSNKPSSPAASELRRERRALLLLREERLRELGGLTLEMYRRDQFNEVSSSSAAPSSSPSRRG